jgi:hypothetical protein
MFMTFLKASNEIDERGGSFKVSRWMQLIVCPAIDGQSIANFRFHSDSSFYERNHSEIKLSGTTAISKPSDMSAIAIPKTMRLAPIDKPSRLIIQLLHGNPSRHKHRILFGFWREFIEQLKNFFGIQQGADNKLELISFRSAGGSILVTIVVLDADWPN